jgi:hypothetical protein
MIWSLLGILTNGSAAAANYPAAPFRQTLNVGQGDDGSIDIALTYPNGAAVNITGGALILTVRNQYTDTGTPPISREAIIDSGAAGTAHFLIVADDTLQSAIYVGPCQYDVFYIDSLGIRSQVVPLSDFNILPASGMPDTPVTVPPAQEPLAQGPQGVQGVPGAIWLGSWSSSTAYVASDAVSYESGGLTSAWIAIASSTNVAPGSDSSVWELYASGSIGPQGPPGTLPSGSDGQFLGLISSVPAFITITEDMIAPGLTLTISGPASPIELGVSLVNPQFAVTHNQTPSAASLADSTDTQAISPPTATAIGYAGAAGTFPARTYSGTSTPNSTLTWAYSATAGGFTATKTASVLRQARVFYGIETPATLNAAFILALPSSRLQPSFAQTYAIGAGSNTKKGYLGWPTAFGTPASFKDGGGFAIPMTKVVSALSVTTTAGATLNYDLWATDFFQNAAYSTVVA